MFLSHLFAVIRRWRLYRQTVSELSHLTDHDLHDLGISRCDIEHVAHEAAATVR